MKMLVTGGAGFIGSNFIFYMLKNYPEHKIICVDKFTYAGNIKTLEPVMKNPNFSFCKADITDETEIDKIFSSEKPEAVVNFAAETHVDRSINNAALFFKTNIIGTQVLLDACRKHAVKRFHQISTDEVYGDLPLESQNVCFNEESALNAASPYAASKAAADIMVLSYYKTYGLNATVSRCSNNYGPYHFPEKLIPLAICRAYENKTIPVYGTGENMRDWIYVEDHCRAVALALQNGRAGEIYNIGSRNEKSNLETVEMILNNLGKSKKLIDFVKDRLGHDKRYCIDFSKAEKKLGWHPETEFGIGIKKTVDWYTENMAWCKSVINSECRNCFKQLYGDENFI